MSYFDSLTAKSLIGSHFGIPFFNASFDYIIVGGGTAGLTLATRLAQNASFTVAVIEAGGFSEFDNGNLTAIPADSGYWVGTAPTERNPLIDWELYTETMPVSRNIILHVSFNLLIDACKGCWGSKNTLLAGQDTWRGKCSQFLSLSSVWQRIPVGLPKLTALQINHRRFSNVGRRC